MKRTLCIIALLAMTAVMVMATGCSKHEAEEDIKQKEVEEALEEYMNNMETQGAADKVPDPNAPKAVTIMVYYPASGEVGLEEKFDDVPEIDDYELTDKLIEYNVLPEGAEVIEFDPENGVIGYTGVQGLTPREAMAVINTFAENLESDAQWELKLDEETVMKSGYCADFRNIDDNFEGGADDFDGISEGGPGVN